MGTEPELIAREGVSRALLREAVRILEHHHVARMRRGPGGGLFVLAPSAEAVTEVAAIFLARRGMRLDELAEMRTGVEVAITDLAAERIDEAAIAGLHDALTREGNGTDAERVKAEHDLHAAVAAAAQNRVLNLVALVLIRLSSLDQFERLAPKMQRQIQAEVLRTHTGIAEAVAAGDRELARRPHATAPGDSRIAAVVTRTSEVLTLSPSASHIPSRECTYETAPRSGRGRHRVVRDRRNGRGLERAFGFCDQPSAQRRQPRGIESSRSGAPTLTASPG